MDILKSLPGQVFIATADERSADLVNELLRDQLPTGSPVHAAPGEG